MQWKASLIVMISNSIPTTLDSGLGLSYKQLDSFQISTVIILSEKYNTTILQLKEICVEKLSWMGRWGTIRCGTMSNCGIMLRYTRTTSPKDMVSSFEILPGETKGNDTTFTRCTIGDVGCMIIWMNIQG
jgi:hypothetical protein